MPAKLQPPVEEVFNLDDTDALLENSGEPTQVTIAQARQREHDARMELWSEFWRMQEENGLMSVKQSISPASVKRKEVFLTLRSCDLENDQGKPAFKFPLVEREFNKAWGELPPVVADEIHSKVLVMNPLWDPNQGEE